MRIRKSPRSEVLAGLLILTMFAAACESLLGVDPDPGPPIQTDGLEFKLRDSGSGIRAEIPYSYRNESNSRVYVVNCNGHFDARLERKRGDDWVLGWGPILPLCLSEPIIIEPGEIFRDTLHVYAARFGSNAGPQFQFEDPEGIYRILWDDALNTFDANEYPFGEPIPLERRVSNQFVLKGP